MQTFVVNGAVVEHSERVQMGAVHRVWIDGVMYSYVIPDGLQLIYKGDTVSFEWVYDKTGSYRQIVKPTIHCKNGKGRTVQRAHRRKNGQPIRCGVRDRRTQEQIAVSRSRSLKALERQLSPH